jgi:hypothetical protein
MLEGPIQGGFGDLTCRNFYRSHLRGNLRRPRKGRRLGSPLDFSVSAATVPILYVESKALLGSLEIEMQ